MVSKIRYSMAVILVKAFIAVIIIIAFYLAVCPQEVGSTKMIAQPQVSLIPKSTWQYQVDPKTAIYETYYGTCTYCSKPIYIQFIGSSPQQLLPFYGRWFHPQCFDKFINKLIKKFAKD